jgi:hypothetical protein
MEHRISFLRHEVAFLERCTSQLRHEPRWGPFLGEAAIEELAKSTGVPLEQRH